MFSEEIQNDKSRFARLRILFGDENVAKLRSSTALVCGCGGVGGMAIDALFRAGFGRIVAVDCDVFEPSNQNRQIGSLEGLGRKKAEVLAEMYESVEARYMRLCAENVGELNLGEFSVILDCIDDLSAKVALAKQWAALKNDIESSQKSDLKLAQDGTNCATMPLYFASTGGAKKIDPSLIKSDSVWKSYGDKFARKFREELKKSGFCDDFVVVFSPEPPRCRELGSFSAVTASFGLHLASLAVRGVLKL